MVPLESIDQWRKRNLEKVAQAYCVVYHVTRDKVKLDALVGERRQALQMEVNSRTGGVIFIAATDTLQDVVEKLMAELDR